MSVIQLATVKQETRKGNEDVLPYLTRDLVMLEFMPSYAPMRETITRCFNERAEKVGIKHYKTPLQTNNGHDPLVDAFQEALDMVMYLTQEAIEEDYTSYSLQNMAIKVLMAIAAKLEAKYGTDSL